MLSVNNHDKNFDISSIDDGVSIFAWKSTIFICRCHIEWNVAEVEARIATKEGKISVDESKYIDNVIKGMPQLLISTKIFPQSE